MNDDIKALADALNLKQRSFVINLIGGMTQRIAYTSAGYAAKTDRVADACASALIATPKVKAYYDALLRRAETSNVMSRDEALQRLSNIGRIKISDIAEFKTVKVAEDENGEPVYQTVWTIKNSEDMPHDVAGAIKSVQATRAGPKLELFDPDKAIAQLCKMQGWDAAQKIEITGKDGKPIEHITRDMSQEDATNIYREMIKNTSVDDGLQKH